MKDRSGEARLSLARLRMTAAQQHAENSDYFWDWITVCVVAFIVVIVLVWAARLV